MHAEHPSTHLLEGGEALVRAVDVGLVHLVGQQRDALGSAEVQDGRLVLVGQHLPGRVARVDDHQRAHAFALAPRLRARSGHPQYKALTSNLDDGALYNSSALKKAAATYLIIQASLHS
jgi:hypothetical protein